ncbi:MAG: YbaB/EbfC family nucleoid-associated protein [Actinomycetota bacterium]
MRKMMRQMEKMQRELAKAQDELATTSVEGTSGGGAVKIVMTGAGEVTEVKIDPSAVDPDDLSLLEDLVLAALNEVTGKQQALTQERLGGLTSGMGLPGVP